MSDIWHVDNISYYIIILEKSTLCFSFIKTKKHVVFQTVEIFKFASTNKHHLVSMIGIVQISENIKQCKLNSLFSLSVFL